MTFTIIHRRILRPRTFNAVLTICIQVHHGKALHDTVYFALAHELVCSTVFVKIQCPYTSNDIGVIEIRRPIDL